MLMYAALALGIVHATLIGSDLVNPAVRGIIYVLFIAVMAALLLKRRQRYLKGAGK